MIQSSNVLERAMALAMSRACVDFSPPPSITPSPTGFTSPKFPKETFFKRAIKRALVVTSFSFENQTSNSGSRLISIIITSSVFVISVSYRIHLGNAFPAPLNGYKPFTTIRDCTVQISTVQSSTLLSPQGFSWKNSIIVSNSSLSYAPFLRTYLQPKGSCLSWLGAGVWVKLGFLMKLFQDNLLDLYTYL